jgi:hypothetical protein
MQLINVDFPAPLAPMMLVILPLFALKQISFSIGLSLYEKDKLFTVSNFPPHIHICFFPLIRILIKNGTPIKAVNMPTGSSMGEITSRAKVSAVRSKAPPKSIEPGIR